MLNIDLDFLNNQIEKIEDSNELSKLYFSIKKVRSKEEEKLDELKNQFEIMDMKLNKLLEKITKIIIDNNYNDDEEDDEDSDDESISDKDVDINTDDIELISSDDEGI